MLAEITYVALFLLGGIFFVGAALIASRMLRTDRPTPEKVSTYECGEQTIGDAWVQYNVKYYLFALLFVIFDVEVVFLFPWAASFRDVGLLGFIEMLIFLFMLAVALAYAWRKGILKWV